MTRSCLDCVSLTESSHVFGIDVGVLQRFLRLSLASIRRASPHANRSVGSLNDNVEFSTGLCALQSIGIFVLIDGTGFEALLRFANAHGRALGNSARTNFLVDTRRRLVDHQISAVFGARLPKTLIFGKLTLRQSRLAIGTVGHSGHTVVFVPIGRTQWRAHWNEIFLGTRGHILLTTNGRIGCRRRSANARGHKSRLANVLALSGRFAILRIGQKFHPIGTDCQIGIVDGICRIFRIETLFRLIIDDLRPQSLVLFATDVAIDIVKRYLFLKRLAKHFGRNGFA